MTTIHHETKFERNVITGTHRAICTCGWLMYGTLEEVQSRAATHDTEWQDVNPSPNVGEGNLWSGPPGWRHEVGSSEYFTDDGRGRVVARHFNFRHWYDAHVDGKLIGTRPNRGQAMALVEKSK